MTAAVVNVVNIIVIVIAIVPNCYYPVVIAVNGYELKTSKHTIIEDIVGFIFLLFSLQCCFVVVMNNMDE